MRRKQTPLERAHAAAIRAASDAATSIEEHRKVCIPSRTPGMDCATCNEMNDAGLRATVAAASSDPGIRFVELVQLSMHTAIVHAANTGDTAGLPEPMQRIVDGIRSGTIDPEHLDVQPATVSDDDAHPGRYL